MKQKGQERVLQYPPWLTLIRWSYGTIGGLLLIVLIWAIISIKLEGSDTLGILGALFVMPLVIAFCISCFLFKSHKMKWWIVAGLLPLMIGVIL